MPTATGWETQANELLAFVMFSSLQAESAERANQTRVREDIERELRIKAEKELKRQALEKAQNLAELQSGSTTDTSKVASNLSNEYRDNSQRTVDMFLSLLSKLKTRLHHGQSVHNTNVTHHLLALV